VEWQRGWTYELRWARGHSGVRSRFVTEVAQVRAVKEWARTNPHVERCSFRVTYNLVGDRIEHCPDAYVPRAIPTASGARAARSSTSRGTIQSVPAR
jgi:hypothetical protein